MEKVDNYAIIENYLMIKMPDEVEHHKAADICRMADAYITHSKAEHIVFDFEDTEFMDSSGIALILRAQQRMQLLDGSVLVCNVPGQAKRVLDAAGIGRLITIK